MGTKTVRINFVCLSVTLTSHRNHANAIVALLEVGQASGDQ
jgi:hypothetical protein